MLKLIRYWRFTFIFFIFTRSEMKINLAEDNWPSVMFAMAGGVVLSLGNLSTQYAWAFVGLSVIEVITTSITVVIGTTLNYFLDNRINRAEILFPGVAASWLQFALLLLYTHLMQLIIKKILKVFNLKKEIGLNLILKMLKKFPGILR
ncbi:ureide permease 3-like [Humulus lupulus]|uniref:ureide permease 3-like n=1 Tax=Humulus lupulus TaxID=3486 RepID=UPI002B40A065|nr:ureide permease 3-like [Humulus lupulus]XP_062102153.1 ureide permease 3-like [Humulus lupulus]